MSEPYLGPVARIRQEMERERAARALAGVPVQSFDSCGVSQAVLRRTLFTPAAAWLMRTPRPWVLGVPMVAPEWLWSGHARVINDPDLDEFVQVWTRKPHRAWKKQPHTIGTIAGGILRGEIKDTWEW